MPKLLQINVTANWGSHGKIAEAIGQLAINEGWESLIAYGRGNPISSSQLLRIGNNFDMKFHGIATRLFDLHGLVSTNITKSFIKTANEYNPDVIHLHNIHGYYLNYPLLFEWLKSINKPVVWTLHDCWPWTGHCAYYTFEQCRKWENSCQNCPGLNTYPKSFWDGSKRNFNKKQNSFLGVENLTLIPVSNWLSKDIKNSFLRNYPINVIHNGINIDVFKPHNNREEVKRRMGLNNKYVLLGVASVWEKRKGLDEFIKLRNILTDEYQIILVGLSNKQISNLPDGIKGISRTNNVAELVELYSAADIYLNPTLEDNFPTTNLEALACGTPVITYNTGGSPEAIDINTGAAIPYGDISSFKDAVVNACSSSVFSSVACRERAEKNFNQDITFLKYLSIYKSLLSGK